MVKGTQIFRMVVAIGLTIIGISLVTIFPPRVVVPFSLGGLLALFAGLWALVEIADFSRTYAFERRLAKKPPAPSPEAKTIPPLNPEAKNVIRPKFCPFCGTAIEKIQSKCAKCGSPL